MIVWLTYCTLVGAVVAFGTSMAERAALLLGWRLRYLWLGAMLLTVGVSLGSLVAATRPQATAAAVVLPAVAGTEHADERTATSLTPAAEPVAIVVRRYASRLSREVDALSARFSRFDAPIMFVWAVVSTFLAALVMREAFEGRRLRLACEARSVKGMRVLLTDNLGPAALGLGESEVLLPRWLLDLEDQLLELVLRHEREHLKAKDPALLLLALGALVALPWELPLWWMWQRLRLAIELDCDGRLLREGHSTTRYAQLLMLMSQRIGRPAPSLQPFITVVAPLHPAQSHLTTRIRIMTQETRRHASLRAALIMLGVLSSAAVAFALPIPHAATKPATPQASQDTSKVYFEFQVTKPVRNLPGTAAPIYPAAEKAAGREGEVLAEFIVNKFGRVEVASLKFSSGTVMQADGKKVSVPKPASEYGPFELAVRDAVPYMRFDPAQLNGQPVRQWVQLPYVFAIQK